MDMTQNAASGRAARTQAPPREGGGSSEAQTHVDLPPPGNVDQQELRRTAEELAEHYDLKMEVAWDDRAGRQVLKVMSPDGKRILSQFPAEVVLKMAERLRSGLSDGLLTSLV
jgi:uncharacterized FlaG/YvyC family protein